MKVQLARLFVSVAVACLAVPAWCQQAAPSSAGPALASPQPANEPPESPPPARQGEGGDVVIHAAGSLQLPVPAGWHVAEVPWIREERLVLTPVPLADVRSMPVDGIWLSYHYRPQDDSAAEPDLAEMIEPRLRLATDSLAVAEGPLVRERVSGWPACEQEFSVAAQWDASPPREATRGEHVLVRTPWGILEVHAEYPPLLADEREEVLAEVLNTLKLLPPRAARAVVDPRFAAAEEILGAWKGYAARMVLHGDGRILMTFDNRRVVRLEDQPVQRPHIAGHFTAEGDLLRVTWDDGSRQNYRWRRSGEDLLLTDHSGQVSALRKLFQ